MSDHLASHRPPKLAADASATSREPPQTKPGGAELDWSVVRSAEAREALLALMATGAFEQWSDLTPIEHRLRAALLRLWMERGAPPDLATLSARTGLDEKGIRDAAGGLRQRDLLVVDSSGDRVIGAYPLTARDTDHRVTLGERTVTAMCAVDALGIGAMVDADPTVASRCAACGTPIEIKTRKRGRAVAETQPSTTVVWVSTRYDGCCAAGSLCTVTSFFCSDDHLASWQRSRPADEPGLRLSVGPALEVGRAIFGSILTGRSAAA